MPFSSYVSKSWNFIITRATIQNSICLKCANRLFYRASYQPHQSFFPRHLRLIPQIPCNTQSNYMAASFAETHISASICFAFIDAHTANMQWLCERKYTFTTRAQRDYVFSTIKYSTFPFNRKYVKRWCKVTSHSLIFDSLNLHAYSHTERERERESWINSWMDLFREIELTHSIYLNCDGINKTLMETIFFSRFVMEVNRKKRTQIKCIVAKEVIKRRNWVWIEKTWF